MGQRIIVTDYCSQCQDVTEQYRRQLCGAHQWRCKQCDTVMDTSFDDDYEFLDEAAKTGGK